jgi:serine/threonine protein kinase
MNISSLGNFGIITKKIFNSNSEYPEEKFITKMLYKNDSDEINISNIVRKINNYDKFFCPLLDESHTVLIMFTKEWYDYIERIRLYRDLYAYACFNGGYDLTVILNNDTFSYQFSKYHNNLKQILNMIKHLTNGIYYLHKNNIVHNDIKLENIVCNLDKSCSLKIIDFGLSDIHPFKKFLTKPLGTNGYIPINNSNFECIYKLNPNDWIKHNNYIHISSITNNKKLVFKTDIFCLGIVLKIIIDDIFESGVYGSNINNFDSYKYNLLEKSNYLKIKFILEYMLKENVVERYNSEDILNMINTNVEKCYIL